MQPNIDHLLRPIDHGFGHADHFSALFSLNWLARAGIPSRNGVVAQPGCLLNISRYGDFGR